MKDLYVKYELNCLDNYHSGEQYGDWYAHYDFSVKGVSLSEPEAYGCYEKFGLKEVELGDVVYVLWMTYSSGDSFGSSTGNGEVLWVFKDVKLALRAKQLYEKINADDNCMFSIEMETEDGEKFKMSNPAAGYFENMGSIEVSTFLVEA